MREACNREDAPSGRARLAGLADATAACRRSAASTRARWCSTSARPGAMRGGVFPARIAEAQARELIDAEPPMAGQDLAGARSAPREVTPPRRRRRAADRGDRHRHQGLDGARAARSAARACRCTPARARPRSCSPRTPTRSSSPTAPATRRRSPTSSRPCASSSGSKPVWGICLGHQLLCRAVGLETFKLPFGHRGANHPVKDLQTGRVEITSQNHGFAALGPGRRAHDRRPTSRCAGRPTSARPRSRT